MKTFYELRVIIVTLLFILLGPRATQSLAQSTDNFIYLPIIFTSGSGDVDLPPVGFIEYIEENVEAGVWSSFEEGVIQILQLVVGEENSENLPGVNQVIFDEITEVVERAYAYEANGTDPALKSEMTRLLEILFPPEENLDLYAVSADSISNLILSRENGANCRELWKQGLPNNVAVPPTCLIFEERVVEGVAVKVYFWADWKDDPIRKPFFQAAIEALEDSVKTYKKYAPDNMPDMTLIMSNLSDPIKPSTYAATLYSAILDFGYNSCPIITYQLSTSFSLDQFKQLVAHEAFHCVQGQILPDQMKAGSKGWWSEGTANYFSNVVYPNANLEQDLFLNKFHQKSAESSLQDMSYETFVFFQYLANHYGDDQEIINILKTMPTATSSTHVDQAQKLAEVDQMDEIFHQFGRDYFDGKIKDTDGTFIPSDTLPMKYTGKTPFLEFANVGDSREKGAYIFILARYELDYEERKRFTQTFEVKHATHSIKQLRDNNFLAEWPWQTLGNTVVTGCQDPTEYFLLITSTDIPNKDIKHLKNKIDKVDNRPCSCYFEAALTGAAGGFYISPAYYTTDINFPLEVQAQNFETLVGSNFSLSPYTVGQKGNFPLHNFALADNSRGLIVGMSVPESIGSGTVTIDESNEWIEGNIVGTLELESDDEGGVVSLQAQFRAPRFLSDGAQQCDLEWE